MTQQGFTDNEARSRKQSFCL